MAQKLYDVIFKVLCPECKAKSEHGELGLDCKMCQFIKYHNTLDNQRLINHINKSYPDWVWLKVYDKETKELVRTHKNENFRASRNIKTKFVNQQRPTPYYENKVMRELLTHTEAFERLISERGWYKRASIPSTTAYKDRQKFIAKKLTIARIETYLFAAGWLKTEEGMYYKPAAQSPDIMGNEPQALTQLIQPNSITNSRSNMNLIQYKILSSIFLQLNPLIKKNIENKTKRLSEELFLLDSSDKVEIEIAYKSFGMATNRYAEIRQALKSLASTTIEFENDEYEIITSLCSVYIPKAHKKSIKLEFKKEVANKLISIQTGYTKYSHEIVYRLNSINSIQFYLMCCSWREKGGFKHDLNWIKRWLSMENKYTKLSDFERWVLKPAQNELKDKADVWFEYSIDKSNSSTVPMINFKVLKNLSEAEVQMYNDRYNKILVIWRDVFKFKSKTVTDLSSLITIHNIKELYTKTFFIHQYTVDNNIENIENYAFTALTNFFNQDVKIIGE